MSAELDAAITAAAAIENQEREAALRFGSNVTVNYNPMFPTENITAPDEFNIRVATGMVLAGFEIKEDRRNIVGMATEIRHLRGVTTPLVISQRPDGSNILCQGYRRYNGVLMIQREEPGSPLAEKLNHLPVLVYTGLTLSQERQLVNDQTSQQFSSADVFRYFMEQYDGGFHWVNICSRTYPQIGQVTNSMDNVKRIDAITDPKEKEKELKAWLTSFVWAGWVNGLKSGPVVRNLWLQTYLWKDGYKGVPRPEVVMDSMRMRKIWAAVQDDQKDGTFNATTGNGPKLDAHLATLAKEDAAAYAEDGSKKRKIKPEPEFALRKASEVLELVKNNTVNEKPNLVARILAVTRKNGGDPEAIQLVKGFDKCRGVFLAHTAYLRPDLNAVLNLLFSGTEGNEETFTRFLMENYAAEPTDDEKSKELAEGFVPPAVDPEVPAEVVAEVIPEVPAEVVAEVVEPLVEPETADVNGQFNLTEAAGEIVKDHPETDAPVNPDGSKKKRKGHAHAK